MEINDRDIKRGSRNKRVRRSHMDHTFRYRNHRRQDKEDDSDIHRDRCKYRRVRRSHQYDHREHDGRTVLQNRKHRRQVKADDIDINRDRDMHRDKYRRVRRGNRYDHRDHDDHDHHTPRHRKHKRGYDSDMYNRDSSSPHDTGANGKVFSQEREETYFKDLRKKRPRLEELVHDLKEVDNSPPLLPLSTDSDIVVKLTSLPRDAVFCILDKLLDPVDHVRFARVSMEWGDVAKYYNDTTQRWTKQGIPLPMLMIPTGTEGEQKLYSVSERRIYDHIRVPVPYYDKCYSSNFGWLATIDRSLEEIWISDLRKSPCGHEVVVATYQITLRNPSREGTDVIHLPPLKYSFVKLDENYSRFIVPYVLLSEDPYLHPENYVILAFCNFYLPLALFKRGKKDWDYFKSPRVSGNRMYSSAIFYRSQIYAIDDPGATMMKAAVSYTGSSPPERILRQPNRKQWSQLAKSYLVESTKGDLLCVRKTNEKIDGGGWSFIERFRVYKIVEDESTFKMLEMEDIGDEAIFLAGGQSICVSATKFPGCQPNSIYHTSNDIRRLKTTCPRKTPRICEMGVYNLDSKVMTELYSSEDERYWNNYMPHWVLPSFNGLFSELVN